MATKKISELTEATQINDNDLLAVVDTTNVATKKMTFNNFKKKIKSYVENETSEVIASGTLSNLNVVTTSVDYSKYHKIIYNVLAASSASRDVRTSGIIELKPDNTPFNASSNFQIYSTSSYNLKGVCYVSDTSTISIQIKEKNGWTNPTYEIVGLLR